MPLTKKGEKILSHMQQEYGAKRGKSVFYASANKGRIEGVHHDADFAAETGEPQGVAINVSKGVTPALLNQQAAEMHAPEHDAEPGSRAEMAARRAGQLREFGRAKEDQTSHTTKRASKSNNYEGYWEKHRAERRGLRSQISGPAGRAAAHARKHGVEVAKSEREGGELPPHKERTGPRK